jgi:hypothetical protein
MLATFYETINNVESDNGILRMEWIHFVNGIYNALYWK